MKPVIAGLALGLFSAGAFAFPCFFTLVKDSCWTDYDVTVNVTDVATMQTVLSITVPKGQSYLRQTFTCQPNQKFVYTATFEPLIWAADAGVVYKAKQFWMLPASSTPKEKAWELPVCFPAAFAEVPFPPKATGNCKCDFASVPPVPLQP